MIDYDKFKYRIGDKVRRMVYNPTEVQPVEYEILAIEEATGFGSSYRRTRNSGSTTGYKHYRLKNLSPGCIDQPQWVAQNLVHSQYEPCNPAAKILFKKNDPELGLFADQVLISPQHQKSLISLLGRRAGKSLLFQEFLKYEANRAEEQSDSHSLDALRYTVQGQPSKKVSR